MFTCLGRCPIRQYTGILPGPTGKITIPLSTSENDPISGIGESGPIKGSVSLFFSDSEVIIRQNEGIFPLFLALFTPVIQRSYLAAFGETIGPEKGLWFYPGVDLGKEGISGEPV
jgi:hypothetical protein